MNATRIEWCDYTINPVVGCSKCSPGCDHCYAERRAAILAHNQNPKISRKYAGVVDDKGKWTGKINCLGDNFLPNWRDNRSKPKRVFVGSMCDLFHENVPEDKIIENISYMRFLSRHTFMLLTKRPGRMFEIISRYDDFPQNIRLGVTVCDDRDLWKMDTLQRIPAANKRFISVEPMLGSIDLELDIPIECYSPIDWVICGGETGPGARPMHPNWARSLRDQCKSAGVPFFFKGWGEWIPEYQISANPPIEAEYGFLSYEGHLNYTAGVEKASSYNSSTVFRIGKKRAGRLLDGIEYSDVPE